MFVKQAFDGELIAEILLDDASSVEAKLERASRAFAYRANWLPAYMRIEYLRSLAQLVEAEYEAFATLIAREGGKPIADARVEVTRAIGGILSACASLENLAGSEIPMGLTAASQGRWAFTTREPIGVVVAISAFNHPLNLIVHQVVPAIATGCPVIVKPSPVTPLCCVRLIELAHAAGIPEPWCQAVVLDDNALAEKLATDTRVGFLSFIGSSKVGWYLRSKIAPGTRCALEHGGAAPVIIDESADLKALIEPVVKGGYYHAGQVCVSTQRIFVHDSVFDDFVAQFTARVDKLRTGDPLLAETEVGPLILPREVTRVESWVSDAVTSGGKIVTGGSRIGDRMFQPTIVIEPGAKALLSRLEIFGPVTAVYRYSELATAIRLANDLPFAFQASIFARDISAALGAASSLNASTVMVNDMTAFRTDWMPFAGWGQSGLGVGGIGHTMQEITREKMIVLKRPSV